MTDRWSATERIFHATLERPVEARAAFLAEACGDDSALRRDVQSLLDSASEPGFLEQPALQVAADLVTHDSLAPLTGQQLGVYRVGELLGRGGMGEVYRAHDSRLGRDVAIKVLPRAFTRDPERLTRFEREARVLASLNHPHIGAIHGLEERDGHTALVLELVEGETLAEHLVRGRIPLTQAVAWARQIADALDAAHEKGIVHRDLKPANIKVTPQDVVKVLDFGLARTVGQGAEAGAISPTVTQGSAVIVGTAAYMSPEQARGQTVDKRTDVWAFGCVLYELLTGKMAFAGDTVSDTLSAVLHREPDWPALPSTVPPTLTTMLRRCLQKDVRLRRRDIGDVRVELDDALTAPGAAPAEPTARAARPRQQRAWRWALVTTGVIAVAALGALAGRWAFAAGPSVPGEAHFKRITDAIGVEEMPAVSPDGKDVAFVALVNGRRQIWVRRLTGGHALQITRADTEHEHPRWTPDSSALVYFTPSQKEGDDGTLWEIPALGGTPRRLASAMTGADVSHDGRQLATFRRTADGLALEILSRDTSTARRTLPVTTNSVYEGNPPRWSPDDRSIAVHFGRPGWLYELFVVDVATGRARVVHQATHIKGVAWLPDGNGIVCADSTGSTMVYPPVFNLRVVSPEGTGGRQLTFGDVSYEQPDIARTGELFTSRVFMKSDVWRFPVTGSPVENVRNGIQITRQTGYVQTPSVSPDGREIAYLSDNGGHSNVWVARVDGSENPRPLTSDDDARITIGIPLWSPVDNRLVFIRSDRRDEASQNEWIVNSDGSDLRLLAREAASAAWSPDGQWLYYQTRMQNQQSSQCIRKVSISGAAPPVLVRCDAAVPVPARDGSLYFVRGGFWNAHEIYKATPENDEKAVLLTRYSRSRVPLWPTGFALSPDERWLAVLLKDRGTTNIWAIPTDGGSYRQLTEFGRRPILIARQVSWARDGRFIFAAIAESEADVVLLDGLLPAR